MNARDIIKLAAQLYVYDALRKHNESDTQNENHTT